MPITVSSSTQQIDDSASIISLLGDFAFFDDARAWVFPAAEPRAGADACLGRLCVSRPLELTHPSFLEPVALHLSFNIIRLVVPSLQAFQQSSSGTVDVTLDGLRFMAHPKSCQALSASGAGGSIIQSEVSIHRGRDSDWSFNSVDALVTRLGFGQSTQASGRASLQEVLAPFSRMYLNALAGQLAVALANRIKKRLKFPADCLVPLAYSVRVGDRVQTKDS